MWNTEWVLIIPAAYLLSDRQQALDTFIDGPDGNGGVSDILLFFQTYAYASGAKSLNGGNDADADPPPEGQAIPVEVVSGQ